MKALIILLGIVWFAIAVVFVLSIALSARRKPEYKQVEFLSPLGTCDEQNNQKGDRSSDTCLTQEKSVELHIATFGQGTLVRTAEGRYELRGGTRSDLVEAREWAAMFLPEAILDAGSHLVGEESNPKTQQDNANKL